MCHCEPVTDVTGVAIPIVERYMVPLKMGIPTPAVRRAANQNEYDCQWQSYHNSMRTGAE